MLLNYIEIAILALINSGGIFLVIVLLANSLNNKLYRWFAAMTICILLWVYFAYIGYTDPNTTMALLFYKLNGVFVSAFLFTEYMFYFESYLEINKKFIKWLTLGASILFAFLILFTDIVLSGVVWQGSWNEIQFGPGNDLFSIFAMVINIALVVLLAIRYRKLKTGERRKELFFLIGTILFILSNILFNVISPEILHTAKYQHLGDYSAVILLVLTAYAILRRKFMNVKFALAALLIGINGTLVMVDVFAFSHNLTEQAVKLAIFVFILILSVLLVRSVLNEIRQREELAKANIALEKSKQRYFDLATEQKDIIDVMGHEIRTPLTAIVYQVNIHKKHTLPFEKELLAEAKGHPRLEKILPYLLDTIKTTERASTHATALVTDMLETARIDKQRFELNYENFDLVSIVETNVELMKKTVDVEDKTIKYHINFLAPKFKEFMIEADKTRINQAVYALMSNAVKYRDPNKDTVAVNVSISKKGENAIIEIKDNGLGIDKEDIHKLGKKFLRLNPKTGGDLPRPGGTGLGLFVVKGIMKYHHGELIIESDGIGKGSAFTLEFPVKKQG